MRGVLPAGTTLRGYELKAVLGQGGFGITYRALDTTLGRDVAIKEYLPTTLAMREGRTTVVPRSADHAEQFAWGRERFLDEARTLARLDNTPGIVRVPRRQSEAVAELVQSRTARQKAEEDLARLRADLARRQIEAGQREQMEAALRRAAEDAARRKAEGEAPRKFDQPVLTSR